MIKLISFFILVNIVCSSSLANLSRSRQNSNNCCEKENTIVVKGNSVAFAPADVIRVGFTIYTINQIAKDSLNTNSEIGNKLSNLFENEQIPNKNITTINFSITPKYDYKYNSTTSESIQIFRGFEVSNKIDVKLNSKTLAAKLVDDIINLGVDKVNYIKFEVEKDVVDGFKKELLVKAIEDAKIQAEIIANQAGLKIKDIKSITNLGFTVVDPTPSPISPYFARSLAGAGERSPSTTIYSNNFEIRNTVSLIFVVKKED